VHLGASTDFLHPALILQLLQELELRVEREEFSNTIIQERRLQQATSSSIADDTPTTPTATTVTPLPRLSGSEVLSPDWWEVPGDSTIEEDTGDYVVIEHSDVIDALANFLAAYIVALPESRSMDPKQLQKAVKQSLKDIRKGKVRKLFDWGKTLYRVAAMTSGAFAAATNPWIADAILRGLFTAARFAKNFW
jgi:hypothetical protein